MADKKPLPVTPLMTIKQVAEALNVDPKTVRRLIKSGEIISHRIGGQHRISAADYERYLSRQRGI